MRDINLIPKKPYAEKAFVPLLAGTIGLALLALMLIFASVARHQGNADSAAAQIEQMQQRIRQVNAARQIDGRTQDYNIMFADVVKIKERRIQWIPVMDILARNVPSGARVVAMGMKEQVHMSLAMQFTDLRQIAEYVAALHSSGVFKTVQAAGIDKQEKSTASALNSKTDTGQTNEPSEQAAAVTYYTVTFDLTLKQLSKSK